MPNRMTPASAVRKNPVTFSWLTNTCQGTTEPKPSKEELKFAEACLDFLRHRGWSHAAMDRVQQVFERYNTLKAARDPDAAARALSELCGRSAANV